MIKQKGIIIVGYQGIGKSSFANPENRAIDLESGNFWVGIERYGNWYIPYCQIAMNLANQGYIVFTSSHKVVVDHLRYMPLLENVGNIVVICPTRSLREKWIEKLKERYETTNLEKDRKAYLNAVDRFDENIVELASCGLPVYQPLAMDYKLSDYVNRAVKDWCDHQ